jgi:DNA-binding transcriptional MerR regulator
MAHHGTHRTPDAGDTQRAIPDKLYFRIGDVAKLCAVPAYVLRFWEGEFPQLKPNKGGTGQRLYRRRDVEMALRIKSLLYDEGFTIPGARQALKTEQKQKEPQLTLAIVESEGSSQADRTAIRRLQQEMKDLLDLLAAPKPRSAVVPMRISKSSRTAAPPVSDTQPLFD